MKLSFFFIFCLVFQSAFSQNSVRYNTQELVTLSKVWGLMKYYHQAVSQGKTDWDAVLLQTLQSNQKETVQQAVQSWFQQADKMPYDIIKPETLECDSLFLRNFDVSWINKSNLLSTQQKAQLNNLVNHPANIGFFYTSKTGIIGYSTNNEKIYKNESVNYRLLNLFRIWNIIEYFYPYKYMLDHKWSTVLNSYIPQIITANDSVAYKRTLLSLSAEINDTHVNIEPVYNYAVFGEYSAPFKFQIVEGSVLVTKIADENACKAANIEVGDLVTEIAGKSIAYNIAKGKQYIPASNESVTKREAFNYLFSGKDSSINVKVVKKNGKSFSVIMKRIKRIFLNEWDKDGLPILGLKYNGSDYKLAYYDDKAKQVVGQTINDNIGYIYLELLPTPQIDSIMTAMKNTKGLVIDLRGYNDGGAVKIFNYLLPKPSQFGIKTQPIFSMPGKFCWVDNIILKQYKYIGKENPDYYKGKVVCIINEYTQSAEEMYAMIFKCIPNVTFVGSQTAGADGNKTPVTFTSGAKMEFSGLGIYYPNGKATQRIGIVPDVVVLPTIQSIRNNQDILVEKAFDIVNGK